jgi:hypothetical protein
VTVSPREPNVGCVFWAISVIYDKAGGSFVKQVTLGRFFGGFSLRQVARNGSATSGLMTGSANAGLGKDRRWVSSFSRGIPESPVARENPGGRETAKDGGCRCWSMPWKNFPGPISAACRAIRRCWSRCAPSWRVRHRLARLAHPVSACETRSRKTDRASFIHRRFAAAAVCRARSRAAWLPQARCSRASSAPRPGAW